LVNIVDSPSQSNFIVPSVIERNGLIISISTSGKAPCLSKNIRKDLTRKFIPRYARMLKVLEAIRQELKDSCPNVSARKSILTKLLNSDIFVKGNRTKPKEIIKRFLKKD
jgi:siroheme synthase-like protein